MKFKVGQKVRIVDAHPVWPQMVKMIGREGIIDIIEPNPRYATQQGVHVPYHLNIGMWWREEDLALPHSVAIGTKVLVTDLGTECEVIGYDKDMILLQDEDGEFRRPESAIKATGAHNG